MTTPDGSAGSSVGLLHELVLFDGIPQLLDLVGPAVRAAIDRGAPVIVAAAPPAVQAVRERFGDSVLSLPTADGARRPAAELAEIQSALAVGVGAHRVCFLTQPPVREGSWPDLRRAEAAVNLLLGDRPVDYLCAYERSALTEVMRRELRDSHPGPIPTLPDPAMARASSLGALLDGWFDAPRRAVESTPPALLLVDPRSVDARRAITKSCAGIRIDLDAMVLAASEMLENARRHGRAPVTLRLWPGPDRVVVTINDRGVGPSDPFHGLRPRGGPAGSGGLGAWIAHQLVDVAQRRDLDGYTVVLSLEHGAAPLG